MALRARIRPGTSPPSTASTVTGWPCGACAAQCSAISDGSAARTDSSCSETEASLLDSVAISRSTAWSGETVRTSPPSRSTRPSASSLTRPAVTCSNGQPSFPASVCGLAPAFRRVIRYSCSPATSIPRTARDDGNCRVTVAA